MDDIMKKFKELSSKEKFGVYAGLALVIAAFLPFKGFGYGGYSSNANLLDFDLGFFALAGGAVGAVFIVLKQPFIAAIGFAVAAVAVLLSLLDDGGAGVLGVEASLKFGAFICIAAVAVGVWATIDALIAKFKK